MTYLITGAAGFIGNHVALTLLEKGETVIGVDSLSDYYDPALKQARLERIAGFDKFDFHHLDISDADGVDALFATREPEFVINLAAQAGVRHSLTHPRDYLTSNISGFLNILEACRHHPVRHLLYASTSSVYGANTSQPFEESHTADHPLTFYAASKRANEMMAHAYSHLFGIPTSGLRFFTVYGPWGRPDMAYFKFTRSIMADEPIDIYNEGHMFRDFTYIDDIVDGIVKLCGKIPVPNDRWDSQNPDPGSSGVAPYEVYNIGNSQVIPLLDFIDTLETAIGKKAIRNMMPMQMGDVHLTSADTSKLEFVTGFKPNTPIATGLQRFVDWYKEFYGC